MFIQSHKLNAITASIALVLPTLACATTYTTSQTVGEENFTTFQQVTNGATVNFNAKYITAKGFQSTNHPDTTDPGKISKYSRDPNHLTIGNEHTEKITIANSSKNFVHGIAVNGPGGKNDYAGSTATVNAKILDIDLYSESNYAYGLNVMNASADRRDDDSVMIDGKPSTVKLTINAENTYIDVSAGTRIDNQYKEYRSAGIVVMSEGELEINGNLYVNADSAIVTRGKALTKINAQADADKIIQLNGDIDFNYQKETSGTPVRAVVILNLANEQSFLKGNIVVNGQNIPEGYDEVNAMNLNLSNGGKWYVPSTEAALDQSDVAVNLALDGGVVEIEEVDHVVPVRSLSGTGGTVIVNTAKNQAGTFDSSKIRIDSVATDNAPVLTMLYNGINADQISSSEDLDQLQQAVTGVAKVAQIQKVAEGDIRGEITRVVDVNGVAEEIAQSVNTKLNSLSSVTAITTVQWRHEMNDLTKRMGELRDSPEGIGSWVRVYGSEQEYSGTTQKSTSIQLGADYAVSDWVLGGAFSYTDGSTEYTQGSGDTKAYSLAAYGTWMADNGLFVDLIAKYSRLENDFSISNMAGSLDNNAYSVSAELGWRFDLNDYVYVEPQAELTYGRIVGDDTVTSNQVKIDQDDTDSFLGRIGLRAGLKFPENKGSVYARVSGVYDFDGESSAMFSNTSSSQKLKEDLGGGWVEYAVGANFNLSPNAYTYVDLERTSGGEVKQDWRWNVGLRYVW